MTLSNPIDTILKFILPQLGLVQLRWDWIIEGMGDMVTFIIIVRTCTHLKYLCIKRLPRPLIITCTRPCLEFDVNFISNCSLSVDGSQSCRRTPWNGAYFTPIGSGASLPFHSGFTIPLVDLEHFQSPNGPQHTYVASSGFDCFWREGVGGGETYPSILTSK